MASRNSWLRLSVILLIALCAKVVLAAASTDSQATPSRFSSSVRGFTIE